MNIRRRTRGLRMRTSVSAASISGALRRHRVVHMLHIGKTGGTALKHALRHCPAPDSLQLMLHGHVVPLSAIPLRDEVFFFLRDPLSRYVSGFNSRRREGRPSNQRPWTPGERRAFERFSTPDELARALSSEDARVSTAARHAMTRIGHVRYPLSRWLGNAELLRKHRDRIVLVGWVDTLESDFERLKDTLDLPASCRLPDSDDAAHRAPSTGSTGLSDEAVANLRQWYRADYDLIEACRMLRA
ncbi:MAG: sulfotransferase family 2 domain-containing protein [Chloroflexi bacterium]|nr:sulfotransferase family 2 domain-containing protein [Chloroflexota bacterium]MBA3796313.1 sulfotransferase family 2 domain-containing protein [Chloroflexota bacterium]